MRAGRSPKQSPGLSSISLFTGAGGLDLGLEAAGFRVAVGVEMDRDCVKTVRHNRDWAVIQDDIAAVTTPELLRAGGLRRREVDLVCGGPPCQPFSKSAYWSTGDTLRLQDPRASTLEHYMRVVEQALPKSFLLENVYGLTYEGKDEGMQYLKARIREINSTTRSNYSFTFQVLNSAEHGVPQIRERVFVIGSRDGKRFTFPSPRFVSGARASSMGGLFETPHFRTAWDAIGDLNEIEHGDELAVGGQWGGLLPSIPEGENYLWHTERGRGKPLFRWRSRYWSMLLKLAKCKPSWTIQAQPGTAIGPFHWKNRRLSMREMCRLQTFPDDYEIVGGITSIQRQLGNAVPSAMAEVLGLEIRRQLFGEVNLVAEASLIPARRKDCPPPERLHRVPTRYVRQIKHINQDRTKSRSLHAQ